MVNKIWGYCYSNINDVLLNLAKEQNINFPYTRWQVKIGNSNTAYNYDTFWQSVQIKTFSFVDEH